ncbi:biopolymer transporter ExbD [bacterium]|nr:biopolymer transporter ExbD [bacterium]
MARTQKDNKRTIELTSLIDVVFLLLVFFLVTFAFTLSGDVSQSEVQSELELPETGTMLPIVSDEVLENLMIQIVPDTSGGDIVKEAYILWPAMEDTAGVSRAQAMLKALRDSTFAPFPTNFVSLGREQFENTEACTLIANSISRYVDAYRQFGRRGRPLVEVRAEQNTEFRILSFIMDQCSAQDDFVPQIVIRTIRSSDGMAGSEHGF